MLNHLKEYIGKSKLGQSLIFGSILSFSSLAVAKPSLESYLSNEQTPYSTSVLDNQQTNNPSFNFQLKEPDWAEYLTQQGLTGEESLEKRAGEGSPLYASNRLFPLSGSSASFYHALESPSYSPGSSSSSSSSKESSDYVWGGILLGGAAIIAGIFAYNLSYQCKEDFHPDCEREITEEGWAAIIVGSGALVGGLYLLFRD